MEDTTEITSLDMAHIPMPTNRAVYRGRISRALRWCKEAVQDHKRSKLRKELVRDVFDIDE